MVTPAWRLKPAVLLSTLTVLSNNLLVDFNPLRWVPGFESMNINEILTFLIDQVMLPVGGLMIAIFAGWVMQPANTREELALGRGWKFRAWYFLIRYLVPLALLSILVLGITE